MPGYKNFCARRNENTCTGAEAQGICQWGSTGCSIEDGQGHNAAARARVYNLAVPDPPAKLKADRYAFIRKPFDNYSIYAPTL